MAYRHSVRFSLMIGPSEMGFGSIEAEDRLADKTGLGMDFVGHPHLSQPSLRMLLTKIADGEYTQPESSCAFERTTFAGEDRW